MISWYGGSLKPSRGRFWVYKEPDDQRSTGGPSTCQTPPGTGAAETDGRGSRLGSTRSVPSVHAPRATKCWALGQGLGLQGQMKAGSDLRNSGFHKGHGPPRNHMDINLGGHPAVEIVLWLPIASLCSPSGLLTALHAHPCCSAPPQGRAECLRTLVQETETTLGSNACPAACYQCGLGQVWARLHL